MLINYAARVSINKPARQQLSPADNRRVPAYAFVTDEEDPPPLLDGDDTSDLPF